jgi:hypothetical protein
MGKVEEKRAAKISLLQLPFIDVPVTKWGRALCPAIPLLGGGSTFPRF